MLVIIETIIQYSSHFNFSFGGGIDQQLGTVILNCFSFCGHSPHLKIMAEKIEFFNMY